MGTTYLRRCGRLVVVLLAVHVYKIDFVRGAEIQVNRLAKIGWRGSTRLLLEALRTGAELCLVDADLARRRELDRTRCVVKPI